MEGRAIRELSVLLITEEELPESRRCAVAALNAKRGDRASVVVTKLVPRLRQTFADRFGWLFVSLSRIAAQEYAPSGDSPRLPGFAVKTDSWRYS